MKRIRIGKDIHVSWEVTVDGIHRDLSVLDLSLVLGNELAGTEQSLPFTTDFDKVLAEYPGTAQGNTGVYRLTLWLNKGSEGQSVLDNSDAFQLVSRTEMEGGEDDNNLTTETVELSGNLEVNPSGDISDLERRVSACERTDVAQNEAIDVLQAGKADTTSVPVRVVGEGDRVAVYNSANKILFYIPAAELLNSGVMSAQQAYDLNNLKTSVPTKQDKVALVEEDSASLVGTLTPSAGSYTRFLYAQNTVAVELPAIPANTTTALALSIYMETGSSPAVTFTSADNTPIAYFDGFAIDANTEYEINCLFNGAKWILAYGVVA